MTKKKDYSQEIYLKYFNAEGKIIKVTLKNNKVLEGIFVGFFHPDDKSEYIFKWHFMPEKEIKKFNKAGAEEKEELGLMILQKDIKKVTFS
ncbi:MAG TPA: hypothetical protein VNZ49_13945 [Bacteroidia bacterium]|jgi:hypothetical protein|nr:hypothetical protein [Bacteroidia bacterium]